MSDSARPLYRRITKTPLRDLVRGRVTGRLDWQFQLAGVGLPAAACELIRRVVKRTGLWPLEKAAVASELMAHFQDGLDAGRSAGELVERFGDERIAARLIRRAKRRARGLPWQVWSVALRVMGVLVAIYVILLIRLCLGQPTVSVDYVARLNEPILRIPESDRAWPIWRRAILAAADSTKDGQLVFAKCINGSEEKRSWPETVQWLDDHAGALEFARQAGSKPAMGFILGAGGSADDSEIFPRQANKQTAGGPLVEVVLPDLSDLRRMARMLSQDAKRAAQKGDGALVEADLMSMLGLGRQLREMDGMLVTQLVALGVDDMAVNRLRLVLFNNAASLKDEQLVRLAHAISGPAVAADVVNIRGERYFFTDMVQRIYTDDGHGDGHVTFGGLRSVLMPLISSPDDQDRLPDDVIKLAYGSMLPIFAASRAELMEVYNRIVDEQEANFHLPMRLIDPDKMDSQLLAYKKSDINGIRYTLLMVLMPSITRIQGVCEIYLGRRDGLLAGISLELYRRRHGQYPATLGELTPQLLPEIPADRITSDPVKYRLIDSQPVVYSVGAERVDHGGKPPQSKRSVGDTVARWGKLPADLPHGDWILFAADVPGEDDN